MDMSADMTALEATLRSFIKQRQDAGIAIRNSRIAWNRSGKTQDLPGGYWQGEHSKVPLCLLGAVGARGIPGDQNAGPRNAAVILGITEEEALNLEAGFEDWKHLISTDPTGPYFLLGRKLGEELEDEDRIALMEAERASRE